MHTTESQCSKSHWAISCVNVFMPQNLQMLYPETYIINNKYNLQNQALLNYKAEVSKLHKPF